MLDLVVSPLFTVKSSGGDNVFEVGGWGMHRLLSSFARSSFHTFLCNVNAFFISSQMGKGLSATVCLYTVIVKPCDVLLAICYIICYIISHLLYYLLYY